MNETMNYVDHTELYTHVGVIAPTEQAAIEAANEIMGGGIEYSWITQGRPEWNEWEVTYSD